MQTIPHFDSWDFPPGTGRLHFEKVAKYTVLKRVFFKSPLRILMPRNHGLASWIYTSSYGGGLVGGDCIAMQVRVGPDAQAVLLTQSTTKVYGSPLASVQTIDAHVEEGGTLYILPDPTICFAGSFFSQKQSIQVDAHASLLLVDTLCAGRLSYGECWDFRGFHSQIRISRNKTPILLESMRFDTQEGNLALRNGRFTVFSTVLFIGPAFSTYSKEALEAIPSQTYGSHAAWMVAVSPIANEGILLRIAGISMEWVQTLLKSILAFLPDQLGDHPWARKW